ncbi:MAG: NADH-quinone oxidoreductase subunit NuoK [Lentimicrobiaceae bacterium]|jgi:NADH-quinone oxidoreductase subunit K|nr:NADH-quinone oxidoreductase subunit NuoK [Lentimicrobiaceae bacterium]MDD4597727.1 NADH-quinone oxidoreductase subunit NuoK [Lentimicrobiaceae bacterium]MDY0026573.1 NADH-quinone oxidoreductase subunit NuoK [Lentimicrobium sp.]HAH59890.1 NADH-quinone oxidoreductase subunit NuoK [Bacteroidales bacterium]
MMNVPMEHALIVATLLFVVGLAGALMRKNLIYILLSVEIMLNAAGFAFVVAGAHWMQADGQVMFIFILTMAAAEVAVGLALILRIYHKLQTMNADEVSKIKPN